MHPQASPPRPADWLALFVLSLLVAGPLTAADPIQEVGRTASEWVKTRAEAVRLDNDWKQDRALLESTINGLKERASRLEDKRDHLLASTAAERDEKAALEAKFAQAKENLRLTETRLQELTDRVLRLRPLLPPRLSEALELSYRSLAGPETSPSERAQIVMTVLSRCAQFNLSITHGEETLVLAGEPGPKSLEVIYWGLSHGYALDRAAGKVWLGAPGPERWQWEPLEGAAPAVAELVAIRRDEADPRLVVTPARLKAASAR